MSLEEYLKSKGKSKRSISSVAFKLVLSVFVLFSILTICKLSPNTKKLIKEELFQTNFNFAFVNNIVSALLPKKETEDVNLEVMDTNKQSPYLDGVKIETSESESVNLIDSGIVVYIGQKSGYGNTVIVQQSNGVDVWYGNISNVSVNLYDYVNKNNVIGQSDGQLYLVFQKNGEFLDYKDYI